MAENQFNNIWILLRDIDFTLDNEITNKFLCSICNKLMINSQSAPCGCTYCLDCIKLYLDGTEKLCPGVMDECQEVLLNFDRDIHVDNRMNTKIMKLMVKCPDKSCEHRGQLKTMPDHIQVSNHQLSYTKCPYYDIGCRGVELVNDGMRDHLQSEMLSHSTLLIQWMNNLTNEMASLRNENICQQEEIRMIKINNQREQEDMRAIIRNLDKRDESKRFEIDELQTRVEERNDMMKELKEHSKQNRTELQQWNKVNPSDKKSKKISMEKQKNMSKKDSCLKDDMGEKTEYDERRGAKGNEICGLPTKPEESDVEFDNRKERTPRDYIKFDEHIQNTCRHQSRLNSSRDDIFSTVNRLVPAVTMESNCGEFLWDGAELCPWLRNLKLGENSSRISKPFLSQEGYKMCLKLYGSNHGPFVRAYLIKGPNDNKLAWPFTHSVTIDIINKHTGEVHRTITRKYNGKNRGREKPINNSLDSYVCNLKIFDERQFSMVMGNIISIRCTLYKDDI